MIPASGPVREIYESLVQAEQVDPETAGFSRQSQLDGVVAHAAAASPYYATLLAGRPAGPVDSDGPWWRGLPLLDKAGLLRDFDRICTREDLNHAKLAAYLDDRSRADEPFHDELMGVSTAGTSGKPGHFAYDLLEQAHIRAQYFRFMRAVLTTFTVQGPLRSAAIIVTGAHMIGYKMQRDIPPAFFRMIPVIRDGRALSVEDTIDELVQFQPHVLTCFGSTLQMLVEYKEAHPELEWVPRAFINTGASLSPRISLRAQYAFPGVRVFDLYGSTDTGYLAWTCEADRLHLNDDCALVELLGPDGSPVDPGESGRVVVTSFWHRTTPLLRYDLGDVLELASGAETCPCGRRLPLVAQLHGRENTLLYKRTDDGLAPVPQGVFMELFEVIGGVRRFQITQDGPTQVAVEVELADTGADGLVDRLNRELAAIFGSGTTATVHLVDRLTTGPGKFLPVRRRFTPDLSYGVTSIQERHE